MAGGGGQRDACRYKEPASVDSDLINSAIPFRSLRDGDSTRQRWGGTGGGWARAQSRGAIFATVRRSSPALAASALPRPYSLNCSHSRMSVGGSSLKGSFALINLSPGSGGVVQPEKEPAGIDELREENERARGGEKARDRERREGRRNRG